MGNSTEFGDQCVITVADLFAKINKQRKLLNRTPVENQARASRCTLRFNIDKQRDVDFSQDKIAIDPDAIPVLEKIVNELFDIPFDGEVRKLCAKVKAPVAKHVEIDILPPLTPEITIEPEKTGLLSMLKGLFRGR